MQSRDNLFYDRTIICRNIRFSFYKFPKDSYFDVIATALLNNEKYPYLIVNIQTRYPHKTILVLDGGGYKKGAEEWIRSEVGNNLVAVYSMAEFQAWVNRGGL